MTEQLQDFDPTRNQSVNPEEPRKYMDDDPLRASTMAVASADQEMRVASHNRRAAEAAMHLNDPNWREGPADAAFAVAYHKDVAEAARAEADKKAQAAAEVYDRENILAQRGFEAYHRK